MKLLRKIKNFLKRIRDFMRDVIWTARHTGLPKKDKVFAVFDILYCIVRFHVTCDEYLKYQFYNFSNCYRKNFLLVYHQVKKYKKINAKGFTKSKYEFYKRIPDCYSREMLLAPDCGEQTFVEFLKRNGTIVTKPDGGSFGKDIRVLRYCDEETAANEFRTITESTVCEGFIDQHEKLTELCPYAVNTIRVQSLRYDDRVEIISATLKTGGDKDSIVDNMHSGGIGAQVDIPSGIIFTFGKDYDGNCYTHHPVSGVQIIGFVVPNWDKMIELVKKAHTAIPECKMLGWDVAITKDGAEIVEANNRPGPTLTQVMDLVPKGRKIMAMVRSEEKKKKKASPAKK